MQDLLGLSAAPRGQFGGLALCSSCRLGTAVSRRGLWILRTFWGGLTTTQVWAVTRCLVPPPWFIDSLQKYFFLFLLCLPSLESSLSHCCIMIEPVWWGSKKKKKKFPFFFFAKSRSVASDRDWEFTGTVLFFLASVAAGFRCQWSPLSVGS